MECGYTIVCFIFSTKLLNVLPCAFFVNYFLIEGVLSTILHPILFGLELVVFLNVGDSVKKVRISLWIEHNLS